MYLPGHLPQKVLVSPHLPLVFISSLPQERGLSNHDDAEVPENVSNMTTVFRSMRQILTHPLMGAFRKASANGCISD